MIDNHQDIENNIISFINNLNQNHNQITYHFSTNNFANISSTRLNNKNTAIDLNIKIGLIYYSSDNYHDFIQKDVYLIYPELDKESLISFNRFDEYLSKLQDFLFLLEQNFNSFTNIVNDYIIYSNYLAREINQINYLSGLLEIRPFFILANSIYRDIYTKVDKRINQENILHISDNTDGFSANSILELDYNYNLLKEINNYSSRINGQVIIKDNYNYLSEYSNILTELIKYREKLESKYQITLEKQIVYNNKFIMKLPQFGDLTSEQQDIVEFPNSFGVYGGAGTGKTMVSIWRHIQNIKNGKKSYLVTFTHTLTYFLEILVEQENNRGREYVNNSNNFMKDLQNNKLPNIQELIIDEAQDIEHGFHEIFATKFQNISYGADDNQLLYKQSTNSNNLEKIYQPEHTIKLSVNFRNSFHILKLARHIFPDYDITDKMLKYSEKKYNFGNKPKLYISNSSKNLDDILLEFLKDVSEKESIAILVPTIAMMDFYKKLLNSHLGEDNFSFYNHFSKGDIRSRGIQRIHLTTFHSSKGLEFDNVIIPNFQNFSSNNKYYVAVTRAKLGLFLFSENSDPLNAVDSDLYEKIEL